MDNLDILEQAIDIFIDHLLELHEPESWFSTVSEVKKHDYNICKIEPYDTYRLKLLFETMLTSHRVDITRQETDLVMDALEIIDCAQSHREIIKPRQECFIKSS